MQTKYRRQPRRNPDKEINEGRKRRDQAVYTKSFKTKQRFGAASKVRRIDPVTGGYLVEAHEV